MTENNFSWKKSVVVFLILSTIGVLIFLNVNTIKSGTIVFKDGRTRSISYISIQTNDCIIELRDKKGHDWIFNVDEVKYFHPN